MSALLVAAILALFPYLTTRALRASIVEHQAEIADLGDAAATARGVPPAILITVAFLETHWGYDPGEYGGWGAPASRFTRHVAGTPDDAAGALHASYVVCGTWLGAISRFRSGLCVQPANYPGYTATYALRLAIHVADAVGSHEVWR